MSVLDLQSAIIQHRRAATSSAPLIQYCTRHENSEKKKKNEASSPPPLGGGRPISGLWPREIAVNGVREGHRSSAHRLAGAQGPCL